MSEEKVEVNVTAKEVVRSRDFLDGLTKTLLGSVAGYLASQATTKVYESAIKAIRNKSS